MLATAFLRDSSLKLDTFVSKAILCLVIPSAPIPLRLFAQTTLGWWYVTDVDCARALRRQEKKALRMAQLGDVLRFEYLGGDLGSDGTPSSESMESDDSVNAARRKRRAARYEARTQASGKHALGRESAVVGEYLTERAEGGRRAMRNQAGAEKVSEPAGFEHGDFTLVPGPDGVMTAFFTPGQAVVPEEATWDPSLWNVTGPYVDAEGHVTDAKATLNELAIEVVDEEDGFDDLGKIEVKSKGDASSTMSRSQTATVLHDGSIAITVVQRTYHSTINLGLGLLCIVLVILTAVANRGAACDNGGPYGDYSFFVWYSVLVDCALLQPLAIALQYVYRVMMRADDEREIADDESSRPFAFLHPVPGRLRKVHIPSSADGDGDESAGVLDEHSNPVGTRETLDVANNETAVDALYE